MVKDPNIINYLNLLCKTERGLTKLIVATKNRFQSLAPEIDLKTERILKGEIHSKSGQTIKYQGLESIKGSVKRRIEKELEMWPIWTQWMKDIPGIGGFIGGNLILLYYYRFLPVCKDCGKVLIKQEGTFMCQKCAKSVKGEGNLTHEIQVRDFPMISSWWHYMGRHVMDGKVPKRAKGVVSDWSTHGRQIGFQIGEAFLMNPKGYRHPYRDYYDARRSLRDRTHPEAKDLHKKNMAVNEMIKLFLSHFWQVARTIDGLPLTEPYIVAKDSIHKIIPPFYWNGRLKEAA